jgi:flagellar biosynthetic protein FliR
VPTHVRALFVAALAVLTMPFAHLTSTTPDTYAGLAVGMAGELILGAIIGLVAAILFVGLQLGGQIIAQEAGLMFGQIADPDTGEQVSIISNLYLQLGTVLFMVIGGHRELLLICLDTFRTIPLLEGSPRIEEGAALVIEALTLGFVLAVRIAAPTLIALFLINLVLGFISRTVPQLNVMIFGFTVKGMVSFIIMAIALPAVAIGLIELIDTIFAGLREMLA